jgi:hypothetical protein
VHLSAQDLLLLSLSDAQSQDFESIDESHEESKRDVELYSENQTHDVQPNKLATLDKAFAAFGIA